MAIFFHFTEILCAVLIFVRILSDEKIKKISNGVSVTKTVAGFFVFIYFLGAIFDLSVETLAIFILVSAVFIYFLPIILNNYLHRHFLSERLNFLDVIILRMKSSDSVKAACLYACDQYGGGRRAMFLTIVERSLLEKLPPRTQTHPIRELETAIHLSAKSPESALTRLTTFREKIETENSFRKRCEAASFQARCQIYLILILFCGGTAFVVAEHGWRKHSTLITIASILVSVGTIFSFWLSRRFKWKV